jgi:hypothetical protein
MKKVSVLAVFTVLWLALIAGNITQCSTIKKINFEKGALSGKVEALSADNLRQEALIRQLGEMEAVHCEIQFVINNRAVFGSIKNGDCSQAADATIRYLRRELLAPDTARIQDKEVFKLRSTGELQKNK